MRSLLRAARPLKKQECRQKVYGLLCVKPDALSTSREDKIGGYYPAQLRSGRFCLREKNFHSLPTFAKKILGSRIISSQISEKHSEENNAKDNFVELGQISANAIEDINVEEEGKDLISEPGFLDEDLSNSDNSLNSQEPCKEKASLELLGTILENPTCLISSIIDEFVKGGGDLSEVEAPKIIYCLHKRRLYGRALQLSEWLETAKQFELNENYYASRIDLIAKVRGVDVAEKYIDHVPESFRGEFLYRTLLANCVHAVNRKKAEAVFEKMRKLCLPITTYACNQMIILYRRFNRRNIADILSLMEEENLEPSRLTYRNLIDIKGESGDTMGMEKLVEAMKSQGLQPDIHVLTIMASHYISEGLKDKALSIMNEIEGGNLQKTNVERSALLSLYASLDMADDVSRIWTVSKLDPTMKECLAAISAWGKLGKVDEAEAVFEMMLEKFKKFSSKIYAELLTVYVQNNEISKGKEFVKKMRNIKGWVGPLVWDGLVRLHVGDGNLGKADLILSKAVKMESAGRVRPLFDTFLFVMEQYAKLGDVHNTEKWLFRMKECGYVGRLRPYGILIRAYINSKTPAYGIRERMKAENIYPDKSFSSQLAQIEALKREVLREEGRKRQML